MAEVKEAKETREINLKVLFQTCIKFWWIIVILAIVGAALAGGVTAVITDQTYEASTMLYVNNTSSLQSITSEIKSLTQGDIDAAKSISDVYAIIIKTRSTLSEVSDRLNDLPTYYPDIKYTPIELGHETYGQPDGFKYDYDYLIELIDVGSVDDTEVLQIKVTSENQAEAIVISNIIADVAINKIASIINGTSVKIVDPSTIAEPISRGFGKNIAIGLLVGIVVAAIVILIIYFVDDVISSESTIKDALGENIPILSTIPDSNVVSKHKYKKSGYGYDYDDYYKSSAKETKGDVTK